MQTIQASEFKAKCLALMDKIAVSGETLVVTKKGKPISVTSPFGLHPEGIFNALVKRLIWLIKQFATMLIEPQNFFKSISIRI